MTKIVCLVLLLAVVFCSVVGWSCNEFNHNLISFSNAVIDIQDEAIETLKSFFPSFVDGYINGDFVYIEGSIFEDDEHRDLVEYSHTECALSIILSTYPDVLGEDFEKGLLIKPELYSLDIKTEGDYYACYALRWNYAKTDYYVIVNTPADASHLLGNRFEKGLFGILTFNYPNSALRLSRNLTKTTLTLSDVEHTCVITETEATE